MLRDTLPATMPSVLFKVVVGGLRNHKAKLEIVCGKLRSEASGNFEGMATFFALIFKSLTVVGTTQCIATSIVGKSLRYFIVAERHASRCRVRETKRPPG